jgi:hypothetical protein
MTQIKLIIIPLLFIISMFSGCLTQVSSEPSYLSYDILPSVQRTDLVTYNDDIETFNILVKYDDTILVDYKTPILEFECVPIVPQLMNKNEFTYLMFNVSDFDKSVIKDSAGIYQLRWSDGNTLWREEGDIRSRVKDRIYLTLEISFNPYELINIDQTSMVINFWNFDHSWSQSYRVKVICIEF